MSKLIISFAIESHFSEMKCNFADKFLHHRTDVDIVTMTMVTGSSSSQPESECRAEFGAGRARCVCFLFRVSVNRWLCLSPEHFATIYVLGFLARKHDSQTTPIIYGGTFLSFW